MSARNTSCDGAHCLRDDGEVRVLPTGGAGNHAPGMHFFRFSGGTLLIFAKDRAHALRKAQAAEPVYGPLEWTGACGCAPADTEVRLFGFEPADDWLSCDFSTEKERAMEALSACPQAYGFRQDPSDWCNCCAGCTLASDLLRTLRYVALLQRRLATDTEAPK